MNKHTYFPKQRTVWARIALFAVLFSTFTYITPAQAQVAPVLRPITFPVIGAVSYYDDFGAPRVGHTHEGNDLMGRKMLPLVSAVNGTVRSVVYPEATWGYSVTIEDDQGYTYHYLHMNNDVPGTDNGQGGGIGAYAPDIRRGNRVVAGQLLGWMGDSGNAETTSAHLHFEIRLNGTPFSPYQSLQAATKITTPVDYPMLAGEILPFGNFQGGATVAVGNLDSDSTVEIVAAAGATGGPHVQIFDEGSQVSKLSFFAYDENFRGGVDVATGDLDADGIDEIITAPGKGGGPEVRIFKADGTRILSFMAYDPGFAGGVRVSVADLNNDNKAEIITAPASGGGSHVKIFQADGNLFGQFMAYEGFNGGIDVAATKASGGNAASIVTSPNTGGGPHVKVFDIIGAMRNEFMAYDPGHRGGVRVAVGQAQGSTTAQIVAAPLLGGPDIRLFTLTGQTAGSDSAFEEWWHGSWDVAVYNGNTYTTTGANTARRTSVRELDFNSFPSNPWDGWGNDNGSNNNNDSVDADDEDNTNWQNWRRRNRNN